MSMSRVVTGLIAVPVFVTLGACSSTSMVHKSNANAMAGKEVSIQEREADLDRRIADFEARMANGSASEPLLPPGAEPGQCFTRVWNPPQYRTIQEQALVSEASERIEIVPAKYRKGKKRVLVQEASTKLVVVPATYKTVTEQVEVEPARTETIEVPAVYETVTERVVDKPAHTVWKKGTGPIQRIDETTGEIMCLVEVPATYKTISKRVLKTPATTRTRQVPAVHKTVTRTVVDQPATTKTVTIPEKYSTVSVVEEVSPSSERRIPIPAKYTQVSRRELLSEGRMAWREILCETNTTPARVKAIQSALQRAGFNPGSIDGQVGYDTMRAINAFQRSKGLPVDKYLNVATVKALGVSLR